jgi:Tol biopolymer transport system component
MRIGRRGTRHRLTGIFISYRRQESSGLAGRLSDRLTDRFGEGQVFMDVDSIRPGVDFAEEISRAVAGCQVLLAVIGPSWLTAADQRGRRRLDNPDDLVRLEVEAALDRGVLVIPILVEGAVMPERDDLPGSLAGLARRNALHIRHESFRDDMGHLITAIEQVLAATPGNVSQSPPTAKTESPAVPPDVRSDGTARSEAARKGPAGVRNGQARATGDSLPGTKSADTAPRSGPKVPASKRQAAPRPPGTPWVPQTQAATLPPKWAWSAAFSADGELLAIGCQDNKVRLWDPATGKRLRILSGNARGVRSVAFSPDGQLAASGDRLVLWDPATGQQLRTLTGHTGLVFSVAFSPDGRLLGTGAYDQTVRVWDAATGRHLRTLTGHNNSTVAFSPDWKLLAMVSDREVRLWNPSTGKRLRSFTTSHTNSIRTMAFSPDAKLLATGSYDDTVRLWDPATGRQLHVLTGHTSSVLSARFSADGKLLATGGYDHTVRVWDPATGRQLHVLTGHTESILAVAFSPNGQLLATGGIDMTILWR